MYSFSGGRVSNPLFELVKYSRFPVMFFAFYIVANLSTSFRKGIYIYFLQNIEVIIFIIVMFGGLINSPDLFNGVFYTTWQMLCWLCTLTFFYLLIRNYSLKDRLRFFFQLLFWSNFIVFPLLLLKIGTLGNTLVYNMAFSDKAFYPYCLLSMFISILASRAFCERSLFDISLPFLSKKNSNLLLEAFLVAALILFCFVSARRTPLFVMILQILVYTYFIIGRTLWKKIAYILFVVGLLSYSIPKILTYIEAHKYELTVLKKLDDIQSGEGIEGDPSYTARQEVWSMYWEIIKEYPLFGVGASNSTVVHEKTYPYEMLGGYSTHNLYVGILAEHGFLGLLMFIIIVVRGLIIILMKGRKYIGIYGLLILLPALAINWAEFNLIPGQVFYWSTVLFFLFPRLFLEDHKKNTVTLVSMS